MKNTFASCLSIKATAVVALCLALSACATGPEFKKVETISADKGLVYIYRPSVLHGAALVPRITVKDAKSLPLVNGSYYSYEAAPGPTEISIAYTGRRSVKFDVKAGETYFVEGGTIPMAMGIPYIKRRNAEEAFADLAGCRLAPEAVIP